MTVLVRMYNDGSHDSLSDRSFDTREEAAAYISDEMDSDISYGYTCYTYRAFEMTERELTVERTVSLS